MSLEVLVNYDHLPPTPIVYGLSIISTTVVFFTVLNYIVKQLSSSKEQDDTWKWRNLFISWIHALIVGVWDLTCFYYYPELTTDLVAFNNLYIYAMVAFSTGYFLYDFLDIIISGHLNKTWEVIPHHIAVAGMFFYNVVQSRCVAYNVVALLSEVNTIFLHSRKLLQMHKWSFDHWLYKLNSALNLLTFIFCRFFGITWIVYGMFIYYDRVSRVYVWLLGVAMFVMWVTNILLFWRLLHSDVIKPYFLQRSKVHAKGEKSPTNRALSSSVSIDDSELRRRKNVPWKVVNDENKDFGDDDDDKGNILDCGHDDDRHEEASQSQPLDLNSVKAAEVIKLLPLFNDDDENDDVNKHDDGEAELSNISNGDDDDDHHHSLVDDELSPSSEDITEVLSSNVRKSHYPLPSSTDCTTLNGEKNVGDDDDDDEPNLNGEQNGDDDKNDDSDDDNKDINIFEKILPGFTKKVHSMTRNSIDEDLFKVINGELTSHGKP